MINIEHDYFTDEATPLAEIEAAGYHPVNLDFPAEENENHWHDFNSLLYITEGELTVTYAETGETCTCGPGTKITGAPNVVHREKTDGYKALIGIPVKPEELTQPINKPLPAPAG